MPSPRDPNAPPGTRNRRRPEVMPGGWLWLVLLVLLVMVMMFFVSSFGGSLIDYSDMLRLAEAGQVPGGNAIIKRVVFVGTDRIEGDLQEDFRQYLDSEKIKTKLDPRTRDRFELLAKKIRGTKFSCLVPE